MSWLDPRRLVAVSVAWSSLILTARAQEPVTPAQTQEAKNGAWAAGMGAVTVGLPGTLNTSSASVDLPTVASESRGEFLAVPIPRVDPALGTGLVGATAYIFKLNRADTVSPPSIIGLGGLWMDSGSWGAGLGGKFYFVEDRFRLTAGVVHADLYYDLTAALDNVDQTVPLRQVADGGIVHSQFRIASKTYLGLRAQLGKLGTTLRSEDAALPPAVAAEIGTTLQVNSIGPSMAVDTRDSTYYPRRGLAFDAGIDIYFDEIDSDVSYDYYSLNYRQYLTLRDRDVLAWQAYLCATKGNPPFFLQCQVGPNSILRGYSFGEHRGDAMAATQAEYRWQIHPRWILALFGGVAEARPTFGDFNQDNLLYAGGAGIRFVVEPKNGVTLRVDYAVSEEEGALYVSVGEAF